MGAIVLPRRPEQRHWLPLAALITGAIGGALLLRNANPYAAHSVLPPCPFHALTGLYCPGCGSTRALYSLLHGDLPQALAMNPLLVIALPWVALMALHAAGWRLRVLEPLLRSIERPLPWLVVLLGYALLRNLPFAPFTLLAPH
ncbi:MAG TPA: DUF2752 domain-containing protein [Xanthomonadaceae bacterium]|jgi:hypothetical protein|nr:DUF2752 domain-containing protein [Xanthomonadaceae bacterium]